MNQPKQNSKVFLMFLVGSYWSKVFQSISFLCFEKVNLSPISFISPPRSLSHQTTNFLRNTILLSQILEVEGGDTSRVVPLNQGEGLRNFSAPQSERDQPQKPNFSLGATSKKSTETEWKKPVCHILVKER